VIPKVALVSAPRNGGSLTSRYFVPDNCHASHAVTGAICVSTCAMVPGSVAAPYLGNVFDDSTLRIEHPSGQIEIVLEIKPAAKGIDVRSAGVIRTARKLISGDLFVPSFIWTGARNSKVS
jgi:2-methylaconitate cis-trans-isomerase PrpF